MPATRARGRQIGLQLNVEGEAPLPGNQPPHRQRPRRASQSVPPLNWYREQLLEKLAELDPSKSRQLRGIKARKTTIIKALEDLGFDPSSYHGSRQMESTDNEGEQQQVAFAITALQQQQQQLQQDGGQERSLQQEIETTVRRMLPEVVQAVISTHGRGATTLSTGTILAQGPASADSQNFHGAPPQGEMAQASLPLQSNRNTSARTNVSLGRLDTQHLGSVNSSHSTSLATAINCNMGASNPPTGTRAALLDTRSSCVHTGNINSNISNGINQHNRSAGVMNAQNGYQVEFGGNPITGLAGAITGQGGNRVAGQGGAKPIRFGRSRPSIK